VVRKGCIGQHTLCTRRIRQNVGQVTRSDVESASVYSAICVWVRDSLCVCAIRVHQIDKAGRAAARPLRQSIDSESAGSVESCP